MIKLNTNFALIMVLLKVSPAELSDELGADLTLISRWRTGRRKLVSGRHWTQRLAEFFFARDRDMISALLREVYKMDYEYDTSLLKRWLCEAGQDFPGAPEKRMELLLRISRNTGVSILLDEPQQNETTKTVTGNAAVRDALLEFLDYAAALPDGRNIFFACPEGLELITRDEVFAKRVMVKLMSALKHGCHLQAVLRTDFKISDVSAFSGAWLETHLMGYIRSYYYDDFRLNEGEPMLICLQDTLVMEVGTENDGLFCKIYEDQSSISSIQQQFKMYLRQSSARFHYGFFREPEDFLQHTGHLGDKSCYLFQQLPHFGVDGVKLLTRLGLPEQKQIHIKKQFAPLFLTPDDFDNETPVRHLFCADAIERAMEKPKRMSAPLSDICGHRVFMSTRELLNQLKEIKRLITEHKNYQACFLPEDMFNRIRLELGVWGSEAAIAWIVGKESTACRDYTNVGALQGYCATVWEQLPSALKTRRAASSKISSWLKRAEAFGYI